MSRDFIGALLQLNAEKGVPREQLIRTVEEAIQAAVSESDLAPFQELVDVLERPFEFKRERERFALPPRPDQVVRQTFCGT